MSAPKPAVAPPAALRPAAPGGAEAKKSTAKVEVAPPARPAPQATVKIAPAPAAGAAAAPAPALKKAEVAGPETVESSADSMTGILAIAATLLALAALGMQVWMFL
jgi:hypothetical protein